MFTHLFEQQGLSLERLHAILLLVDHGSLIRAAYGDAGRQSRLSHHIKELSAYFGIELTERIGKTVQLTTAGEELARIARAHFTELSRFKNSISKAPPTFRFGAGDSLLQWLLIPGLSRLVADTDRFRFSLSNLRTQEINSRLQDQRLDFGLLREEAVAKELLRKPACLTKFIIVVPKRFITSRRKLSLNEALIRCPHASLAGDGAMRAAVDQIAHGMRERFTPQLLCDSIAQCVAAVKTTHFAAILPSWSWRLETSEHHSIFSDPELTRLNRSLVLAWHPRLAETYGKQVTDLVDELVATLQVECS